MDTYTHTNHWEDNLQRSLPLSGTFQTFMWTALSSPHHERSKRWYTIAGTVAGLIALYGIVTGGWTLSVLILLIAGAYYMIRNAKSVMHRIRLEQEGFLFDDVYTAWRDCAEFWIVKTPLWNELHILRQKGSPKEVIIQTPGIDTHEIVASLSRVLKFNADRTERLLDLFIRICKL